MNVATKLTKARANLVMAHPFFGALALRLKMKESDQLPTAGVDGGTIYYNPAFVEKLTQEQVQGLVAHEVLHPAFLHHTRRGARNHMKWNRACDFAINNLLVKSGFVLPEGGCVDPKYDGMTAEEIYSLLPEQPGDNGEITVICVDPGGDGGVMDSPNSQNGGGSQSQQNNEEAEWKVALAQALHVAKQAGKLPGGLERLVENLLKPVLPWRDILRRFMTEKSNDDFSWARGNRRFIAANLYLPSRQSEGSGEIVVVIDTSGSIGQKELDEFGSEVQGIVKEAKPSATHVIYCDAAVAHVDTFKPEDELQFAAHGGGGTDFRPPFAWLAERGMEPKCLVYLTDGYGPFGDESTYPVMWVINNNQVTPPWGEHLTLEV